MKHTPGPWKQFALEASVDIIGPSMDIHKGDSIATVWSLKRDTADKSLEEQGSNAALIAAAPEMFALLKNIASWQPGFSDRRDNEEVEKLSDEAYALLKDKKLI